MFPGIPRRVALTVARRWPSVASRHGHTSNRHNTSGPTALVFLNMGGPASQAEVGDFLERLFSDSDLIPFGRFQSTIARFISRMRTPRIQKQYATIGGGSPIRRWTEKQAAETCKMLDTISPTTAPHKPYVAFRYASPLTEDMYAKLLADGFGRRGRVVAFSQYPQYSCGTTGSSLNELYRWMQKLEGQDTSSSRINWSVIDRWPTHPMFIEAVASNIIAKLETYPPERRKDVTILFSAHSQPIASVNKGDVYATEVAATVAAVMTRLNFCNPYRLCWQSKVGFQPWLGPRTDDVVKQYIENKQTDLVLVPIAFTTDHIETLFELDEELIQESGYAATVKRAESLNDGPEFIQALAHIAKEHLEAVECSSRQLDVRCVGCKKDICGDTKELFLSSTVRDM